LKHPKTGQKTTLFFHEKRLFLTKNDEFKILKINDFKALNRRFDTLKYVSLNISNSPKSDVLFMKQHFYNIENNLF